MAIKGGRSRRSTFFLVMLLVAVSAISGTVYTLWRLRVEAVSRHFEAAVMFARVFEDHLTQSFNVIDQTMMNTLPPRRDDTLVAHALADALSHAPYLRSLSLLDEEGSIVASSDARNVGVNVLRGDFLPPSLTPRAILRAGLPWAGRDFYDGRVATPEQPASPEAQTLIPLWRDLLLTSGGVEVWRHLLASVNSDYFLNYYSRSLSTDVGTVELLRYDGVLLLSSDTQRKPGSRDKDDLLTSRLASDEIGHFEQRFADDRVVLTAYRASRSYPFVVVVHLNRENGLADWQREAARTVAVVFIVLLTTLALASLYFVRMERAARQHDADVEQLRVRDAALKAAANAIIITNRAGSIEWVNPAFLTLSGYSLDEVLGRNPREIIKSGMQTDEDYRALWRTIVAGKVWHGELLNRRKDGSCYPEDQIITPVFGDDGEIRHFIAVKQDISERRKNEARMAELSHHLVLVQESARRRLSGELHDRTSPNLAAIGINLDIIDASLAEVQSPVLAARLEDVRALIEDTTASIREICSDLRPPVLDYAGLVAALESYARQFQRRSGIAVRFDCLHPVGRLAPDLESVLFRIVQEALTNCAKHSRARSIAVALSVPEQTVRLSIADDGIGFDPATLGGTTHTGGLGILTMREMAEFSGGSFALTSMPGMGVRIEVEIGLKEEMKEKAKEKVKEVLKEKPA